jgi:hypothetical protein
MIPHRIHQLPKVGVVRYIIDCPKLLPVIFLAATGKLENSHGVC